MLPRMGGFIGAVVCLSYGIWLTVASAYGSQASAAGGKPKTTETTISLVLVDTFAEDKKCGAPIDDLRQEDFLLRDNG